LPLQAERFEKRCEGSGLKAEVVVRFNFGRTTAKIDIPAMNGAQINVCFKRVFRVINALILASSVLIIVNGIP
jgi:hypothetical protein